MLHRRKDTGRRPQLGPKEPIPVDGKDDRVGLAATRDEQARSAASQLDPLDFERA